MINSESTWLSWRADPIIMLQSMEFRCSDRKLRMFFSGCVRLLWAELHDERSKAAVDINEQYADGLATEFRLIEARRAAYQAWYEAASLKIDTRQDHLAAAAMMTANEDVEFSRGVTGRIEAASSEAGEINARMSSLLRSILGNPFRLFPTHLQASLRSDQQLRATAEHYYRVVSFGQALHLPLDRQFLAFLHQYDPAWRSYTSVWCRGNWLIDVILGYA